jgi:golgin subfamily A member 4
MMHLLVFPAVFSRVEFLRVLQVTEERDKLAEVTKELSELKQKVSESVELERKVQDLEQKLQLAYSKSDEQASIDTAHGYGISSVTSDLLLTATNHMIYLQAVDTVESRSREFSLDSSTSSGKQQDKTQAVSPNPTLQGVQEPSGIMAFKFILGVALLSVLIGVFLGKRY